MVKDDGKQWLIELVQSITSQLKEDRTELSNLWAVVNANKEAHNMCREHILKQIADLDKRVEIAVFKIGIVISVLLLVVNYGLKYLLGDKL